MARKQDDKRRLFLQLRLLASPILSALFWPYDAYFRSREQHISSAMAHGIKHRRTAATLFGALLSLRGS